MNTLSIRILMALQSLFARDDERGQTLAEYGLILSVVAVSIVVVAGVIFRSAIIGAFNSASDCLNNASTATSTGC